MDKDIDIEVGDLFVITRKGRYRNRPCPYADKVFVVKSITNSGLSVYYEDGRTNIRCKCINCSRVYMRRYDEEGGWSKVGRWRRSMSPVAKWIPKELLDKVLVRDKIISSILK